MDVLLKNVLSPIHNLADFKITGSKSESNRMLILQALYPSLVIKNLSNSDDTVHMQQALASQETTIDIGHAGTAMRFLTAYYAAQPGAVIVLTGSERMQQRPIGILVNALKSIGARIEYLKETGYPPLKIYGGCITGATVAMDASVSSQYITALMLIAPSLENGLEIKLTGQLTSRPYIDMTIKHLQSIGVSVVWQDQVVKYGFETLQIKPLKTVVTNQLTVESDWSSAGYWFSWVALQAVGYQLTLQHYFKNSVQGDSKLQEYYEAFGVQTRFKNGQLMISKKSNKTAARVLMNLANEPDQAQTIFATCLALGVNAQLTGLHTLRIKETDRIEALRLMGLRFRGSEITTTQDTISLTAVPLINQDKPIVIDTFKDHRMALAFAPLSCKTPLIINDAGVVSKSYPAFWEDLKMVNIDITEI